VERKQAESGGTFGAGGTGPAGRAGAGEAAQAVGADGGVLARRTGAVVLVDVAARAGPTRLAGARVAGRGARQRARTVRARLRRARVVNALAVHARESFRARAQVLVGRRVLARAAMLARLVSAAVVEI
jgi:hypothetical protein